MQVRLSSAMTPSLTVNPTRRHATSRSRPSARRAGYLVSLVPSMAESALAVYVPEAEKYVSGLREKFDPSARLGAPAHITLVYPFAEPGEIGASTLSALDAVTQSTDG